MDDTQPKVASSAGVYTESAPDPARGADEGGVDLVREPAVEPGRRPAADSGHGPEARPGDGRAADSERAAEPAVESLRKGAAPVRHEEPRDEALRERAHQ